MPLSQITPWKDWQPYCTSKTWNFLLAQSDITPRRDWKSHITRKIWSPFMPQSDITSIRNASALLFTNPDNHWLSPPERKIPEGNWWDCSCLRFSILWFLLFLRIKFLFGNQYPSASLGKNYNLYYFFSFCADFFIFFQFICNLICRFIQSTVQTTERMPRKHGTIA